MNKGRLHEFPTWHALPVVCATTEAEIRPSSRAWLNIDAVNTNGWRTKKPHSLCVFNRRDLDFLNGRIWIHRADDIECRSEVRAPFKMQDFNLHGRILVPSPPPTAGLCGNPSGFPNVQSAIASYYFGCSTIRVGIPIIEVKPEFKVKQKMISFVSRRRVRADGQFTIGQLAEKVKIPASTVRYYERIGLLGPEDRSQGNYRLYGQVSLRRLRFIRAAQSAGFTLDDIRLLMGAQNRRQPSCRDVQRLIAARLTEIDKQMTNLRQVQKVLKASAGKCRKTERSRCCHLIESLEAISETER